MFVCSQLSGGYLYTTWKARSKKGEESIVKHCIDYIFYNEYTAMSNVRMINNLTD